MTKTKNKTRIIRNEGGSKVLTLDKSIPDNWKVVEIDITKVENGVIILKRVA